MERPAGDAEIPLSIRRILYVARWVVIAGVVVVSEMRFTTARVERAQVIESALAVAALTIVLGLAARSSTRLRNPLLLIIADVTMVGVIVFFSDGAQSPFYALFYVTLIEAAATFGTYGALVCAFAITVLTVVSEAGDPYHRITEPRVVEDLVRTTPYLFLVAVITGALRDRIRALATTAAEMRAERETFDTEMELARKVQRAQLPLEAPPEQGMEIAVLYKPAREVGGDLYDFYPIDPERLGITVANVSGKGVPAALLVASAKYAVRECYAEDTSAMMREVNKHLLSVTTEDNFVTVLHGLLKPKEGEFSYVNAGHMPPIVVSGATGLAASHDCSDMPLGISAVAEYVEKHIRLEAGDTLVLYTDGMTDALGSGADGVGKFVEVLSSLSSKPFSEWREELSALIRQPRHVDDVTVVAIRIK